MSPADACEWGVRRNVDGVRDDLARIGVHFDTWFSERTLHERGDISDVLRVLEERGVFSAAEFEKKSQELRKQWNVDVHEVLAADLPAGEYFAAVRRIFGSSEGIDR